MQLPNSVPVTTEMDNSLQMGTPSCKDLGHPLWVLCNECQQRARQQT